jgi:hypothetical protein
MWLEIPETGICKTACYRNNASAKRLDAPVSVIHLLLQRLPEGFGSDIQVMLAGNSGFATR